MPRIWNVSAILISFSFSKILFAMGDNVSTASATTFQTSKVWNNDYKGGRAIGSYEGGKIWNNDYKGGRAIGSYGGGKIWNNDYKGGRAIGSYSGPDAGAAAAAYLLLL